MENEVDKAATLGVALIAIAALLVLVLCAVGMGLQIRTDAFNTADDINHSVRSSELAELGEGVTEMPVAAAYQVLRSNYAAIDRLYYYNSEDSGDRDKTEEIIDDMGNNLKGRCKLYVEKQANGAYNVTVHLDTCSCDESCMCY